MCCFLTAYSPAVTCWADHVLSAIPSFFGLPHPGGHMLGWPCPVSHTVPFWPTASRWPHAGLAMSCQPYRPFLARRIPAATCWAGHVLSAIPSLLAAVFRRPTFLFQRFLPPRGSARVVFCEKEDIMYISCEKEQSLCVFMIFLIL